VEFRRFAFDASPFYRRFHRRLDRRPLEELPILTKALMMEHFDELVTDRTVRLADADAFLGSDFLLPSSFFLLPSSFFLLPSSF
jgi:hypothetical protein